MDRLQQLNEIKRLAADLYDNATMTFCQWEELNPGCSPSDYARELVEVYRESLGGLDERDAELLRWTIAKKVHQQEAPDFVDPDEDQVDAVFACPRCGEDRTDYLVWNADGTRVTCASCNATYDPCA